MALTGVILEIIMEGIISITKHAVKVPRLRKIKAFISMSTGI